MVYKVHEVFSVVYHEMKIYVFCHVIPSLNLIYLTRCTSGSVHETPPSEQLERANWLAESLERHRSPYNVPWDDPLSSRSSLGDCHCLIWGLDVALETWLHASRTLLALEFSGYFCTYPVPFTLSVVFGNRRGRSFLREFYCSHPIDILVKWNPPQG